MTTCAHFNPGENVSDETRRLVAALLLEALAALSEEGASEGETKRVHQVRTSIKKARSLLRLVRSGLDDAVFVRENAALREAARRLAPAREGAVLPKTLAWLSERRGVPVNDELCRILEPNRNEAAFARLRERDAVSNELRDVLARTDSWVVKTPDLRRGLRATFASACRRNAQAQSSGAAPDFHAFRKRVRNLEFQIDLGSELRTKPLRSQTVRVKKLGKALGKEHDLSVLRGTVADAAPTLGPDELASLLTVIDEVRDAKRRQIARLAARVLRDGSRRFSKKFAPAAERSRVGQRRSQRAA